ncbi:energy transducer TonB [Muricoccus radiodurans]|uniref:energy transducer TonB n=1 Tax=Muricoccus radiodurans TaxID=2231721 RepID=UPI003CF3D72A
MGHAVRIRTGLDLPAGQARPVRSPRGPVIRLSRAVPEEAWRPFIPLPWRLAVLLHLLLAAAALNQPPPFLPEMALAEVAFIVDAGPEDAGAPEDSMAAAPDAPAAPDVPTLQAPPSDAPPAEPNAVDAPIPEAFPPEPPVPAAAEEAPAPAEAGSPPEPVATPAEPALPPSPDAAVAEAATPASPPPSPQPPAPFLLPAPPRPAPPRRPPVPRRPAPADGAPVAASGASARGPGPAARAKPPADYIAAVQAVLARNRIYPAAARDRRAEGVVLIGFTIRRDGSIGGARIERSSGDSDLDLATEEMLRRSVLPPLPPEWPGAVLPLTVPITYRLR